jgi:hypothetical protein
MTVIDFSSTPSHGKRRAKSISAQSRDLAPDATRYLVPDAIFGVETKSDSRRREISLPAQPVPFSYKDNNLAVS